MIVQGVRRGKDGVQDVRPVPPGPRGAPTPSAAGAAGEDAELHQVQGLAGTIASSALCAKSRGQAGTRLPSDFWEFRIESQKRCGC